LNIRSTSYIIIWCPQLYRYYGILQIGYDLHHIVIEILRQDSTSVKKCSAINAPFKTGETKRISCQRDAVGSIVMIRQALDDGRTGTLALCEVKVYGTSGKTVRT